jgi:hypothetical protein
LFGPNPVLSIAPVVAAALVPKLVCTRGNCAFLYNSSGAGLNVRIAYNSLTHRFSSHDVPQDYDLKITPSV